MKFVSTALTSPTEDPVDIREQLNARLKSLGNSGHEFLEPVGQIKSGR